MRCKACNAELTDYDSTRKEAVTQEYLDLCTSCYSESNLYFEQALEDFLIKHPERGIIL